MRRLAGFALTSIGMTLTAIGAYPWMETQLLHYSPRPRRYHYYYVDPNASPTLLAYIALGCTLMGLGLWFAFSPRGKG
jgi:hypothetical protein